MRGAGADPGAAGRDTNDPQAYAAFAEGRALYTARRYQDAVATLERAVSRDPDYGSAWAWLAKTYARLAQPVWSGGSGVLARATEAAQRAAEIAPQAADTRIALALAARGRADVQAWRAEAQRAVDFDPLAAEAYALLGDSYSAMAYAYACDRGEDPKLADEYYRKALELRPDLTTAVSNRAANLRRMGRYAECIDLLNRALRSFSDESPLKLARGGCRLMQGDLVGAAEDIEPLRNSPKIAPGGVLVQLGLLELKRGEVDEGIRDLEAAANIARNAQAELIVAEAYAVAGDMSRLSMHLKRAFDMNRSCAAMVAESQAFRSVRDAAEVIALLGEFGVH